MSLASDMSYGASKIFSIEGRRDILGNVCEKAKKEITAMGDIHDGL